MKNRTEKVDVIELGRTIKRTLKRIEILISHTVLKMWVLSADCLKYDDLPYLEYMGEYEIDPRLRPRGSYSEHLYCAVRHLKPSIAVELGVKAGVTMKYMLDAVKRNRTSTRVIGIDLPIDNPQVGDPYAHNLNGQFYKDHSEIWRMNTQDENTVKLFISRYHHIDLLFIDADHSYQGVLKDYHVWAPIVRGGGYIFFDDLQLEGPRKVWNEIDGEKYLFATNRPGNIQICGLVIKK